MSLMLQLIFAHHKEPQHNIERVLNLTRKQSTINNMTRFIIN